MDRRLFLAGLASCASGQIETLDLLARQWDDVRRRIDTVSALRERNAFVRARMRTLLHVPPTRPKVHADVTGTLQRDGYRMEKVVYESGPDLWVTSTLYIPEGAGPWPGVIVPCGHYELGRLYPDYQFACIDLVRSGFVVLIYDPQAQGERRALDPPMRSVDEHSLAGQLLLLIGDNLTAHMVRDGMCGIDYLLTRSEVDGARIGCAGHSGGGTMTMFLACVDERIGCVAINEGGTYHRWPVVKKVDSGLPISDAEQNLFPGAVDGMDICDMHVAIAPRPLLVTIENYAPAFDETAAHIRARYELLGEPGRFATEEAKARHAWTPKLRLATVDWLLRWFHGRPGPSLEDELKAEAPETLYCTTDGKGKGGTIFSYVRTTVEKLPARRRITRAGIRRVLRMDEAPSIRTRNGSGPVLFVDDGLPDPSHYSSLIAAGVAVEPVIVRGLGRPGKSALFDDETALQYMAWYTDRCLVGMRVMDVLAAITHDRVQLIGRGMGALLALYAAALDDRIATVVCDGGLVSYRALTQSDRYLHGANIFVRDVLLHFDLPDVAALVAPRKVVLRGPVDAMKRPTAAATYDSAVRVVPASTDYLSCLS